MFSELRVGLVVIAPNGGFLEGAVHPLDLTVGPGMVRLGEAVLGTMLAADAVEHVQPVAGRARAEPLWKRHPIHCAIYASPKWHAYLKTKQIRCIGRGGSE